jgi:S-adenosylmethionine:tRNA ribosyltransferase-isomerase
MEISDFDYTLPQSHIAHQPVFPRDTSKLMVINRTTGTIAHHIFTDLPDLLDSNTLLVLNDTRVYPARIFGQKPTGGKVELLLVKKLGNNTWEAMSKPGLAAGTEVNVGACKIKVLDKKDRTIIIQPDIDEDAFMQSLEEIGTVPIPPYIHTSLSPTELKQKYQTVYAKESGSSAAPTAGLHFTEDIFKRLKEKGIDLVKITLHVGMGTFAPVDEQNLKEGKLHSEFYEISQEEADAINNAKKSGKKVVAVGTTSMRALESATDERGVIHPQYGETSIFITPGYAFRIVDGLVTNFHLPQSSLLMLVSAFCSWPNTNEIFTTFHDSLMGKAYKEAVEKNYRFFSFGDSSLIM